MQKLTKIIATIGPASDSEEMIKKLILSGVNIFRFNFKHNTVEWHNERIQRVNKVAHSLGISIGTLIDLQGPEIRINMPYEQLELEIGDLLLFGEEAFEKKERGFSISHPDIIKHLKDGQKLVADDGAFTFKVVIKEKKFYLKSESVGVLKQRKSLNIPGADFPFPVLVDRDFEGLKLVQLGEVDFVALSFVRSAQDLITVRKEMKKFDLKAQVVAKIETQKAIDDLDAIIKETDAIMIARGDLGVELPIEQVPFYQKLLIRKCIENGKAVITATQMLQTMTAKPFPTRAEVSDVANATYDLTDAVMLSEESAAGNYPLETVQMMNKTIVFNENKFVSDIRKSYQIKFDAADSGIAEAAYSLYLKMKTNDELLAGFLIFTRTGKTARLVSQFRPHLPIFTFVPTHQIADSLSINYGVHTYILSEITKSEVKKDDLIKAIEILQDGKAVKKGSQLIVLYGDYWAEGTVTSTVKVLTV